MAKHRIFSGGTHVGAPGSLRRITRKSKGPAWRRAFEFPTVTECGGLRRFVLDFGLVLARLRTATRTLGERRLNLLDRLGLGDALHRRDLARQTVERGFIELPLGVGLLRLRLRAIQVAHDLGDR